MPIADIRCTTYVKQKTDAARLITGETLYIDGGYHIND